jgi:hypothetical protein
MAGRIAYYGNTVTNGLVLSLDVAKKDSYPGSGTAWRDISGNNNNGTLTNGPTFNSDNGGAIVFDGTNDFVSVPDSTSWDFTVGVSIEFWVYLNAYGSIGTMFIHQQNGTGFGGFEIWSNTSGVVRFNKNAAVTLVTSTASFVLNRWNHVVCIANGTTAGIYLNSVSIGSASASLPDNVTGILRIGGWVNNSAYQVNGRISSMKIYNIGLSATEVLQNYNAVKSRYGL